jgi:glycosyltransferase involved in cell wall biosynthesis
VIHYQQGHLWFNFALPFLRRYPLVVTIHDPRHHAGDRDSQRTPQRVMDFGFRRADRVIVHGDALKREAVDILKVPHETVQVIPHVAIGCTAAPTEADDDGATILFFGRIWAYKGLEYLIKAEPLIRQQVPNARIVIAGQGEDFDKYRAMMGRPEAFRVHNHYIGAEECEALFRRASVVVLPYTEATQSGVIPLAYSYAKPVVATRVGALADAVEDGVTGMLVPPRDEAALAAAVVELLNNPELRHAMGVAGREKLDREWSPAAVAEQAVDVYRRAIQQRNREMPAPVVVGRMPLDSRKKNAVEIAAK